MSFLNLCGDDPLLSLLRTTFKANPIRIPEERITPLSVFAVEGKDTKYIGELLNLLTLDAVLDLDVTNSEMANVAAAASKKIEAKVGLQILDGFLNAFNVGGASINFAFKDVSHVSFSFGNIQRKYIDLGLLSRKIFKHKFDKNNAIVKSFISGQCQCVLVDSIITSNMFSIVVDGSAEYDFTLELPKIQEIVAKQNQRISVSASSKLEITFQGPSNLAFAFSGVLLDVDDDGSMIYQGEPDQMALTTIPGEEHDLSRCFFIYDEFGLVELLHK